MAVVMIAVRWIVGGSGSSAGELYADLDEELARSERKKKKKEKKSKQSKHKKKSKQKDKYLDPELEPGFFEIPSRVR